MDEAGKYLNVCEPLNIEKALTNEQIVAAMNTTEKIFLIDDDQFYLFSMKRMIEINQLSKSIVEYKNGLEAITSLKNTLANSSTHDLPDVIFLDINMPIMNGWEFMEAYETLVDGISKPIKIYMVSSSIDENDRKKAKAYKSVTDYIIKPVSISYLKELLS